MHLGTFCLKARKQKSKNVRLIYIRSDAIISCYMKLYFTILTIVILCERKAFFER